MSTTTSFVLEDQSIAFGLNYLESAVLLESIPYPNIALICDENLMATFGEKLSYFLRKNQMKVHFIPFKAQEKYKSRQIKQQLEDLMLEQKLSKDTTLIALGGGITLDLAGFIAATYCRGIPFISIPSSLLAIVDASLGGKVGVNTSFGKNLIGTIYQPQRIIIDMQLLDTLPKSQWKEGFVEVVKIALTCDETFFYELSKEKLDSYIQKNVLEKIITKACQLKLSVVSKDKEDSHYRHILNFGHTVGHALEHDSHYKLSHGQSVALGIIAESYISNKQGLLKDAEFELILDVLKRWRVSVHFDVQNVIELMQYDKKSVDQNPRFVLLKKIGQTFFSGNQHSHFVDRSLIIESLHFIRSIKE